jgi:large subunit ribosomal protein L20
MVRVTNGLQRQRKHKKFIKQAKGYRLGRKNVYKQVRNVVRKTGEHQYRHRKLQKRVMRKLWIERLSAVIRSNGGKYSTFIAAMGQKGVILNRKVLSNVAVAFPDVFDKMYQAITK